MESKDFSFCARLHYGDVLKCRDSIGNHLVGVLFKGARSRYFKLFCLISLIMSPKRQIGRPRVFHLINHGHMTTENDFAAE